MLAFLLGFVFFYLLVAFALHRLCNARMGITIHWGTLIVVWLLLKCGFSVGCETKRGKARYA